MTEPSPFSATLEPLFDAYPDADRDAVASAVDQVDRVGGRAVESAQAVVATLLDLRLDPDTIVAALLTTAARESTLDLAQVARDFSAPVVGMVEVAHRLSTTRWRTVDETSAEGLRKLFLSLASDMRGLLIVLALSLDSLRTVTTQSNEERQAVAQEARDVYAPLAARLGIWQMKWELEDRALEVLQPDVYTDIRTALADSRDDREAFIAEVVDEIRSLLASEHVTADVYGRPKHIYSIYRKMQRKQVGFEEIYDVNAIRLILDNVRDCYAALGLVHGRWSPVPGEFDDYIAKPKDNYYRSLHTAVIGPRGRPFEVQFRTREMHEFAEYGVAAHWRYKQGSAKNQGRARQNTYDEKVNWLRQLLEWQRHLKDPQEFVDSLKTDVFQDQVHVFTRDGDVVELPLGSTPIDFAYRIHTEVGHRCRGARVNEQIVALDYQLRTGDRVEVLTAKHGAPSRDWLNTHQGYVRTASARQKIRQWFRRQGRQTAIENGREIIERELKRLRRQDGVADVARLFDQREEDLLAAVGFGDLSSEAITARLLDDANEPSEPVVSRAPRPRSTEGVRLAGADVLSHPARCCHPVPGDDVVGFITRGRGLTIHRRTCPNIVHMDDDNRVVEVTWGVSARSTYPVTLRIVALDRPGIVRDVADVISSDGVNISEINVVTDPREKTATVRVVLDVRGHAQLSRITSRLRALAHVTSAKRIPG